MRLLILLALLSMAALPHPFQVQKDRCALQLLLLKPKVRVSDGPKIKGPPTGVQGSNVKGPATQAPRSTTTVQGSNSQVPNSQVNQLPQRFFSRCRNGRCR